MDGVLAAALAGLVAGIAVAMPLGAIGVLLVHEGMTGGWRTAAAGATGVALVDLAYCALAVLAGTGLSRALAGWDRAIHLTGALLLVAVAGRGLLALRRERPQQRSQQRSREPEGDSVRPAAGSDRAWRVGARFVGLTAVNPLTAVYFVALAAGLGRALDGWPAASAFVLAVFAASWAWQLTLAGFGALAGARLPARTRQVTGVVGYVVVLGYAAHLALT
jgi:arginine exporter protein ArgO